jgi:hypothetical protein
MTDFLDELARSMAKPLPRRRALRLLGGAVVAATVPGLATRKAHAASRFHRCEPEGGRLCECNCKGEVCQRICCTPKEMYDCKCGTVAEGAGCKCIRPCGSASACCKAGEHCGNAKKSLCCKNGEQGCGEKCCERFQKCASSRRSFCCDVTETPCLTKKIANCCTRGETCCNGGCCTRNQTCRGGECECKPGTSRGRCGGDCCHPTRDKCCPGRSSLEKHCVRKDRECCGPSSCPPGATCCSASRGLCARKGEACCDGTPYDPTARKCCGGGVVCPFAATCCDAECCTGGKICTKAGCQAPTEARASMRRSAAASR